MNPDPGPSNQDVAGRSRNGVGRTRRCHLDGAECAESNPVTSVAVDARWVAEASSLVLAAMEEHRSTWQMWHVRAEAQRHVRGVEVPPERVSTGRSASG